MSSFLGPVEIICAVVAIFIGYYYYLKKCYSFWEQNGVPGPEPSLIFGNFKDIWFMRVPFGESLVHMFDEFPDAPMVGIYARQQPLLLVRDPELIRDIFIKDFASFSQRGGTFHEEIDPLDFHLFNLDTKRWRSLRQKLSPAFTSGKMKNMFHLILECADYFEKYLEKLVEKGEPIDCREISAKFTTDVIGSCAFGLQMNSIADEDSEFRKMGKRATLNDTRARILTSVRQAIPWLYRLIKMPVLSPDVTEFFTSTVKQTLEYRMKNNVRRADLMDLLLDLKKNSEHSDIELTDTLITAQAFVFFIAGFETSSTTISHALYELAQRQDIQDKVREEILESLEKNDGILTYESVKEMEYLHMVFEETLRLRPPVPFHIRQAVDDYTFKGTNVTIKKGQGVFIPLLALHHNPEYYPNPEIFDPERFREDVAKSRNPMTFLPFGDGPRNCIGARFAVYQSKLGLIKMLSNFKIEVCDKTQIPYKANPKVFIMEPIGGIHLKFTKIK